MKTIWKIVVAVLLTLPFVTGCKKPAEPESGGDNDTPAISDEFVDLGLPSGTLWATRNVGADKPEDCGDYFAWGETAPKELYDWKSYRYGNCIDNWFAITKYCTNSDWGLNGFVDSLTVLEPVDDAATVSLGDDWRMPTKEEWEELYQNTSYTWTTLNGVDGRLLTGPNGNTIFLSATGFRLDGELICLGLGIYWSSTLHSHFPERGWSYHFDFESCHVCGTYERSRGQCIRAVRVAR